MSHQVPEPFDGDDLPSGSVRGINNENQRKPTPEERKANSIIADRGTVKALIIACPLFFVGSIVMLVSGDTTTALWSLVAFLVTLIAGPLLFLIPGGGHPLLHAALAYRDRDRDRKHEIDVIGAKTVGPIIIKTLDNADNSDQRNHLYRMNLAEIDAKESELRLTQRFEWAIQDMHEKYGLGGKVIDHAAEIGKLRIQLKATREENEAAEKSQTAREQRQHREKMETLDKEYAQALQELDANNAHELTRFIQELEMKQRETPEERFVRAISAYQRARTMMDWINDEPDPNERRRIRQEIRDLMSKAWK